MSELGADVVNLLTILLSFGPNLKLFPWFHRELKKVAEEWDALGSRWQHRILPGTTIDSSDEVY